MFDQTKLWMVNLGIWRSRNVQLGEFFSIFNRDIDKLDRLLQRTSKTFVSYLNGLASFAVRSNESYNDKLSCSDVTSFSNSSGLETL